METRIQKHKAYRESLIRDQAISKDEVVTKGKHFNNSESAILPINDVINTSEDDKIKNVIQDNLEKKRTTKIIIIVIALTLIIVGIIIFAVIAFGGKK